jgi:putative DNA methylase
VTDRRLIEEFLPVAAVSYEATREKLLRRRDYHISTLHLWWARRPLAAARAAVYAALVPAPDEIDPEQEARFFQALCAWGGPESTIAEARRRILEANDGQPPKVLDMFAGGGAIPLEATRLGCETTALELNPVAHLIELCTLDYPQRFGPSLADDVRRWGGWLIKHAKEGIGDLYPELVEDGGGQTTVDGATEGARRVPIAYLWTRTVPCPNPAEKPHMVPLVRQTWLVKKKGRYVALRLVLDRERMAIEYEVVSASTPKGLGFDPEKEAGGGGANCPLCGAAVSAEYARRTGRDGRYGYELMTVGLLPPAGRGKTYLGSREARQLIPDQTRVDETHLAAQASGVDPPTEPIPPTGNAGLATGKVFLYGMRDFADLFTKRQLATLLTLCKLVREAHSEMLAAGLEPERAKAVATYLGMLIDRVADRSSTLCRWDNSAEKTANTYARQALQMLWDFSEANPFGGSSGDLAMHLAGIAKVVEHCAAAGQPGKVLRGSATELPLEDGSQDAVIIDPPYYDNISYADLSDFFYVWLKRSVGHLHPEHLSAPVTPKRSEAIAASYRHNGDKETAKAAYEEMMALSFEEARRVLKPNGVLVCVYAHQTTVGWSTLIEAVRRAGFVVVEAWPLDTEMPDRGVAQGTASLASSIFLVARPRTEVTTGDWASQVRPELTKIVEARVAELPRLGITGTDLVIAAVGAGMRAYTRFARVEKPNGEELSPTEYLEEVEREVAEAVLARIFQTDRRGLGRVDQTTQFYVMGRFEFGDTVAPWDELNTLARGTGIELAPLARGPRALVAFGDRRDRARLRDYADRGRDDELGLDGARSTIDHLHRILWLLESRPGGVTEYVAQARPDPERLRLVAHALARPGLDTTGSQSPEAAACEKLLAVWHRVLADNLFTGGAT